jgi:hypothetical protein
MGSNIQQNRYGSHTQLSYLGKISLIFKEIIENSRQSLTNSIILFDNQKIKLNCGLGVADFYKNNYYKFFQKSDSHSF